MNSTLALATKSHDTGAPRRIRVRHGIASPLDLDLTHAQAMRVAAAVTVGDALDVLLSLPGVDRRFADACRKTLNGPCVVELRAPDGPSIGAPATPVGDRLSAFPIEIGFSKAVRGGCC